MHQENQSSTDDLNTAEIQKITQLEGSIELRLAKTREEANRITGQAREEAEDAVEGAHHEAASIKTKETERVRQEEIDKSKLLIREAEKTAAKLTSQDTDRVSKKLFEEFQRLI